MPPTNYEDVQAFHAKFGVGPEFSFPHFPPEDVVEFRFRFLYQELEEVQEAYAAGDLPAFFDGLLDLVYVAMGTADLACLPWDQGWAEVQRSNMAKERARNAEESMKKTGRGHRLDVVKPDGWTPPDLKGIIDRATSQSKPLT